MGRESRRLTSDTGVFSQLVYSLDESIDAAYILSFVLKGGGRERIQSQSCHLWWVREAHEGDGVWYVVHLFHLLLHVENLSLYLCSSLSLEHIIESCAYDYINWFVPLVVFTLQGMVKIRHLGSRNTDVVDMDLVAQVSVVLVSLLAGSPVTLPIGKSTRRHVYRGSTLR